MEGRKEDDLLRPYLLFPFSILLVTCYLQGLLR